MLMRTVASLLFRLVVQISWSGLKQEIMHIKWGLGKQGSRVKPRRLILCCFFTTALDLVGSTDLANEHSKPLGDLVHLSRCY